jgi:ATP-dependent helicase HrpB
MTESWSNSAHHLPIYAHLGRIGEGIRTHQISLLEAPPGSGKTTVLPLLLLEQPWLKGQSIIMLQPRRVAARSVATRMAEMLAEHVGDTVGYQVRLESRRSSRTRLEVITEGLLTRKLLSDPSLEGVGIIIFDEFHERRIHGDIGLSLALETATILRPDLKIVVMSATLGASLPELIFKDAWRYSFEGTPYPVALHYSPPPPREPVWLITSKAIKSAMLNHSGDILAFLPGAYEIERTIESLAQGPNNATLLPLYGELPYSEQQRALAPDPFGKRKIILATTIAETSLTIDGVTVVVDSGLHKVSYSDSSGFTNLTTEPISRDAADQRAGRAGRTAPGVCIRLWSEQEHIARRAAREPEILRADCTSTVLDLAAWGVSSFDTFAWITPPPKTSLNRAIHTLCSLGALDSAYRITETGRALSTLATHPRLGKLAIEGHRIKRSEIAGTLIALLEERDILQGRDVGADLSRRIDALSGRNPPPHIARVREMAHRWRERIERLPTPTLKTAPPQPPVGTEVAYLLATAFPEGIAKRRSEDSPRYLLASGSGATLSHNDPLTREEFIVVASMRNGGDDAKINLASPLPSELLTTSLSPLVSTHDEVTFDDSKGLLLASTAMRIGAITLKEGRGTPVSRERMKEALISWLASPEGFARITWPTDLQELRARVVWARSRSEASNLPDLSDEVLRASVGEWLAPFLNSASLSAINSAVMHDALQALVHWNHRKELDAVAPEFIILPSGRSRRLQYGAGDYPMFEARIQELFGVAETPLIGRLKIPALIHLLSPAHRPTQVTRDLANFWRASYPEIRKELRGRYPKHKWPEDPLNPEKAQ